MHFTRFVPSSLRTVLVLAGFLALAAPVAAQRAPGSVGIGAQLGTPSGITLKIYNPNRMSPDFLAAWDTDDFFFLNLHGVYEKHLGNTPNLHFFYGPGVFVGFRDRERQQDDDVVAGLSGTFGINYVVEQFEIFGQLTPRLSVIPDTDGNLGGGVGFRFYF